VADGFFDGVGVAEVEFLGTCSVGWKGGEGVMAYGEDYTAEISCKLEMSLCWVIPEGNHYCASCSSCSISSVFVLNLPFNIISYRVCLQYSDRESQ